MNRRARTLLPLALAGTLALAACGGNAAGDEPAPGSEQLQVVTSTTVYANLVEKVGGDAVQATALIDSVSQDPHSYEATSRDKLAMSKARLVVANGGGYDAFMDVLAKDLDLPATTVIRAVDTSPVADEGETDEEHADHAGETAEDHAGHDHAAFNEHVWYDLESMRLLSDEIAARLSALDPAKASTFTANAAELATELQGLEAKVATLRGSLEAKHFAMTEPVPFHLLEDLGMEDATPEGLSESIEGGSEVSPQAFNEMGRLFDNGAIDVLAYNTQTQSPQTERIRALADAANVEVIDFTETLPPSTDYVSWMDANIRALEALAK
ncbi:metal ABC transporter solute-binding protein, Zn/Mn family [Paeniglutamicibacter psychrophenolicus]|uniref:metal ABC transporter solute-binding protein, Zn/Mn family n=1 Tax=Paeniglutamicibacter psychrophenolicus TaxID=257454 RepID=UPI002785ED3A|nr:zinc ABC transporter substrate-binding protein [Paeniglutamicibacter psychrophenolicus]MDQ0095167.1 zinc/manganese transport system substrate-binding protein [Paeniglutamicibacter psychrophenolicus]